MINHHTIYRELGGQEVDMSDYRELCRVHIDLALTDEVRELKAVNVGAYYDTIFDLSIDHSLLHGASIEEAIWTASLICGEY